MATKRITVRVCDVCGAEEVTKYTITVESRRRTLDLCAEHAQPLEDVIGSAPSVKARGRRVYTLEEIEARKGRNAHKGK